MKSLGVAVCMLLIIAMSVAGQCSPGFTLIGEDDHYWYCSNGADPSEVQEVLAKQRPEFLGNQWRFRKEIMESVASLARSKNRQHAGTPYEWGGKIRFSSQGKTKYVCVSDKCKGTPENGIDCSGAAAFGELSACFVGGFYGALPILRGLESHAAGQAAYFKERNAFLDRSASPVAGDLIFFENTARNRRGITHVAIYIGTTHDGRTVILHASSRAGVVLFDNLGADLRKKIVGYGDSSRLLMSVY